MTRRGVLAGLTVLTLCHAGAIHASFYAAHRGRMPGTIWSADLWLAGLWYALPMLAILVAHEGAHWLMCLRYRVPATGPYFLPLGLPMVGTFGAFIRTHGPYPSRRAQCDIAVAGPLAGGAVSLAAVWLGSQWTLTHEDVPVIGLAFGRFGAPWFVDALKGPADILHPLMLAGWIGCVITGLNLLPYGQFDGGEIVAALVGPQWALAVSVLTLIGVASLMLTSMTACAVAVVMAITGWHSAPTVRQERAGLYEWSLASVAGALAIGCLA